MPTTWTAKAEFSHGGRRWRAQGVVESHPPHRYFDEWSADVVELYPVEGDCTDAEAHSPELSAAAATALIDSVAEEAFPPLGGVA